MKDISQVLMDNRINLKHYGEGNQKVKCPSCQPPHNPKDNPLSVTIENNTVVWNCHHCDFKGGSGDGSNSFKPKTYQTPVVPESKSTDNSMYKFFGDRGISKSTVDSMKIFNENSWIAFQYFDEHGSLVNVKYRTVDKQFRQSPNAKRILYNYDNVYKSDTVIFCEGEMDCISLFESGITNSTTLPDGAPKEAKFDPNDARFKALDNSPLVAKNIIIFTDNDTAGRSLHKELLHRFGKDRCWYVKCPEGCKDANEVLMKHGATKLKELIDNAIPYPINGLYKGHDYFDQLIDLYEGNYEKPVEIGMGSLDDIYKIMTGTFHVITGIPNHGKSLILDQILLNLAKNQGWKFAIFSPEHSTSMHIRRMTQMYCQKAFDEGFGNRMSRTELVEAMGFIDKHFYFIESKDAVPEIDLIIDIAKSSVYKHGVNGIVIDPYNEVSAKREGNQREDEHIRDFISSCKRFARNYEVTMWVVAHPTKLPKSQDGSYLPPSAYDISGAAHWHNQSDAVLTIHRDFDDNSTSVITRKIREQDLYGKIGQVKFFYDMDKRIFIERQYDIDEWSL
jgi:twinkle protein